MLNTIKHKNHCLFVSLTIAITILRTCLCASAWKEFVQRGAFLYNVDPLTEANNNNWNKSHKGIHSVIKTRLFDEPTQREYDEEDASKRTSGAANEKPTKQQHQQDDASSSPSPNSKRQKSFNGYQQLVKLDLDNEDSNNRAAGYAENTLKYQRLKDVEGGASYNRAPNNRPAQDYPLSRNGPMGGGYAQVGNGYAQGGNGYALGGGGYAQGGGGPPFNNYIQQPLPNNMERFPPYLENGGSCPFNSRGGCSQPQPQGCGGCGCGCPGIGPLPPPQPLLPLLPPPQPLLPSLQLPGPQPLSCNCPMPRICPPPAPLHSCPPLPLCPPPLPPPPCPKPLPPLPCPQPLPPPPCFCPPPPQPLFPPPPPPLPLLPPPSCPTPMPYIPQNDCCCNCQRQCRNIRIRRYSLHGSKTFEEKNFDEKKGRNSANPKCNSSQLQRIIIQNISDDLEVSKRRIQASAERQMNRSFNTICGAAEFSFIVHAQVYCQATLGNTTCYTFSPL